MKFILSCISVLFLLTLANVVNAQELSAADARKRTSMSELLGLLPVQERLLDTLFTSYAAELSVLDERIKAAERDPQLSEDEVVFRMNVISQERKDLKEIRELDIKAILTPDQRTKYEEKIQPVKPQVLHFGLHNKMDCKICLE